MDKSYWLYLEPYVTAVVKGGNHVALYNTHSGDLLEYQDRPEVTRWVKRLTARKNLYVVKLSEAELSKPRVAEFVGALRDRFMGDLLDTREFPQKPVQMVPFLNIEKDAEKFKKDAPDRVGEDLMTYVSEISLYLTDRCPLDCPECSRAYRQFLHCTRAESGKESRLSVATVARILQEAAGTSLSRINLLGGDVLAYPGFEELAPQLLESRALKSLYLFYMSDLRPLQSWRCPGISADSHEINLLVHFPVDERRLKACLDEVLSLGVGAVVVFLVKNDQDVDRAMTLDLDSWGGDRRLQPFFDGTNLDFFEKNVFLTRETILEARPSLQEVFSRQAINGNLFGKLTIFPDGGIYSNVNFPSLGNINRKSLYEAVYKEMLSGKGWRLTRRDARPCNRCVFEALCPPLSNYELAIGRNNLCDVWEG